MKNCNLFLLHFAQNINCGYSLEQPHEYPQPMFSSKIKKNNVYLKCGLSGYKLHGRHYEKKRPCNILQYSTALKKEIFEMKTCDVFLIIAQNIDCGYTLEPPH